MNSIEKNAVKSVAKIAPWLAPGPSAFFVSRSAMAHLDVPMPIAVVIAGIVETLGLASVHTWLWLSDWNANKRKRDPEAPVNVAAILGVVYLVATIGLTVILEVQPSLSTYAPALFPILAVVGAVNLALIARQEQREEAIKAEKEQRRIRRQARRQEKAASNNGNFDTDLDTMKAGRSSKRQERKRSLLEFYSANPSSGPTEASRAIEVSRQTVYTYQNELIGEGRLGRNGRDEWEVG
jgi:hypothetical protein